MVNQRSLVIGSLLLGAGLVLGGLSLWVGPIDMTIGELYSVLSSSGGGMNHRAVWQLRMPRTLGAFLVGGALSVAGLALQGLFRNPLAAPGVLGVSSGGAFGAILVILLGGEQAWLMTGAAFLSALLTVWGVYRLATRRNRTPVTSLLLAGLAVGAFFSAMIGLAMTLVNPYRMNRLLFWLLGGLGGLRWSNVLPSLLPIGIGLGGVLMETRKLDLLSQGEASARSMGVNIQWLKARTLVWVTLLTATAVAMTGVIGFVGLIVPHVIRMVVGPSHRRMFPLVFLAGGVFLVGMDLVSRWIIQPAEIRIGIVTALMGVPFFLWLLRRRSLAWSGYE